MIVYSRIALGFAVGLLAGWLGILALQAVIFRLENRRNTGTLQAAVFLAARLVLYLPLLVVMTVLCRLNPVAVLFGLALSETACLISIWRRSLRSGRE